jgi:hypothetical protein
MADPGFRPSPCNMAEAIQGGVGLQRRRCLCAGAALTTSAACQTDLGRQLDTARRLLVGGGPSGSALGLRRALALPVLPDSPIFNSRWPPVSPTAHHSNLFTVAPEPYSGRMTPSRSLRRKSSTRTWLGRMSTARCSGW